MRRSKHQFLFFLVLVGCSAPRERVYVDAVRIAAVASKNRYEAMKLPRPPASLGGKTFVLPGAPSKTLENSSSPQVLKSQTDARTDQAQALSTIRKRLTELYLKQADLFSLQQAELLGDPNARAIASLLPRLHAAFVDYANLRLPIVSRLDYLAGTPDNNRKNAPPPTTLKPVQKEAWMEAMKLRGELAVLDAQYSAKATAILGEARAMASNERLAMLKKVDDFRRQMVEKASIEALGPRHGKGPLTLKIEAAPPVTLPSEASRSIVLPATPTLPPAPQVEFEKFGENAVRAQALLDRQMKIWSATKRYEVVAQPSRRTRDATEEFIQWRKQQQVGP